jgi:signal transduction histidine kinase
VEITPKETRFNDLCEELKNISFILTDEKKLNFSGGGSDTLIVDVPAVSQGYENIVSNAVRYAKYEINITCEVKDGILSIIVADDGQGFTPQALKNAAEPFFRDDKKLSDSSHFGIGLYICRLLCEKHGGTLTIENAGGGKVTASFSVLPQ